MTPDFHYDHILCPVDFSETSRRAFHKALACMKHFGCRLTLLHVRKGSFPAMTFEAAGEQHGALTTLERALAERVEEIVQSAAATADERQRISLKLAGGKRPFTEILRYARDASVDLIVMGTHGDTGFKHIFMGSQAEHVVRRASCDVLCVKPEGYQPDDDLD